MPGVASLATRLRDAWRTAAAGLALLAGLLAAVPAAALTAADANAIARGDADARLAALQQALATPDAALARLLAALRDDAAKVDAHGTWIVGPDGSTLDAATGQPATVPPDAEDVVSNNRLRGIFAATAAALQLLDADVARRRSALAALKDDFDAAQLPLLERAIAQEPDAALKARMEALRATLWIHAPDAARRLQAVQALAATGTPEAAQLLQARTGADAEPDAAVRAAALKALGDVQSRLAWGERLGTLFTGLSLGSILLLAALGLAITYGLMGVINMAHGEFIMIGAYATAMVQGLFRRHWPGAFDAYIVAALPVAFLAAALVGALLERTVIRRLYGRPLETLLATWGLSLILIQAVRTLFGAQNVEVENPAWLAGGLQVLPNLILPYNRLAILAFAAIVVTAVALLIARTRLGLFVRSVTQNRTMASCVGVNTARVDTLAFALGAGVAGLAGCALSQVGNVGPDLGQSYIVDSFMVVVLGGVGQLTGTVLAALALGLASKLLEGWTGAVLAKITVLVFIVLFIQKRPQGLFALKGRSAEA